MYPSFFFAKNSPGLWPRACSDQSNPLSNFFFENKSDGKNASPGGHFRARMRFLQSRALLVAGGRLPGAPLGALAVRRWGSDLQNRTWRVCFSSFFFAKMSVFVLVQNAEFIQTLRALLLFNFFIFASSWGWGFVQQTLRNFFCSMKIVGLRRITKKRFDLQTLGCSSSALWSHALLNCRFFQCNFGLLLKRPKSFLEI